MNKRMLIGLIIAATQFHSPAFAGGSSFETDANARIRPFSINDQKSAPIMRVTTTTVRHRFGVDSGIGSSSMQTQSATSERSHLNFQKTIVTASPTDDTVSNPLREVRSLNPALTEIGSSSLISPVFSKFIQKPQSFEVHNTGFSALSSPFSDSGIRINSRQSSDIGGDLVNPLKGL